MKKKPGSSAGARCRAPAATQQKTDRATDGQRGRLDFTNPVRIEPTFDIAAARPLTNDAFYCGRFSYDRSGQPVLLAFLYYDQARQFLGELSDPMPVGWENGELKVTKAAQA